jgi:hypothetical protein
MKLPEIWNPCDYNSANLSQTMGVVGPTSFQTYASRVTGSTGDPIATEYVAGKDKLASSQKSVNATISLSPGSYVNNFFTFAGEARLVNQANTAMTFTIPRSAAGAGLFREPTILYQPGLPTGSNLASPALANKTNLGDIAAVSCFTGGGFKSAAASADATGLPVLGQPYIGFYIGCFPLQWYDKVGTNNQVVTSYNTVSQGSTGEMNYYLQYQDPWGNWVTYDQKQGKHLLLYGIMQDSGSAFITPENDFGHRDEAIDPRSPRFCFINTNSGSTGIPTFYPPPFSTIVAANSTKTGWINQAQSIVLSARNGTSYGEALCVGGTIFATKLMGWYPGGFNSTGGTTQPLFQPGAFSQNNPNLKNPDLTTTVPT